MIDKIVGVTAALKDSPGLLAIVLLQFVTMAMVYFLSTANAERVQVRELALIAACRNQHQPES